MTSRLFIFLSLLSLSSPALAQSPVEAYVSGGAGSWSNDFASGALAGGAGGAEWRVTPYIGIAGEAGAWATPRGDALVTFGGDGRVHFRGAAVGGGWAPYALAGYARLVFFEASDNAFQFGLGADYPLTDRRAVRFEFRGLIRESGVTSHYWTVRVGLSFR